MDPEERVKSTTLTDTCTVREDVPEVAVTVTVKVEGIVEVTVKVDEPELPCDIVTLVGFREVVKPCADAVANSDTAPVKPLMPVTLIEELPENPTSVTMES